MRAGVRPGLQILWSRLCRDGRFDSDSLPPRGCAMKTKKPKPFKNTVEIRRQARLRVGSPPPAQVLIDKRDKPPKHKKRAEVVDPEIV